MKKFLLAATVLALGIAAASADGMVGKKLPDAHLDFVGTKADWEGKPLLLEFWATWCPPCRQSIPHLNEIYKEYKDKGLVIVGVTDEPNAVIKKFQKDVPMDYPVATDNGGRFQEKFNINGIPHAFLVNKAGEIVWEGHPMQLKPEDIAKALQ